MHQGGGKLSPGLKVRGGRARAAAGGVGRGCKTERKTKEKLVAKNLEMAEEPSCWR